MKTVTFSVRPLDAALLAFSKSWKTGEGDATAHVSFASWEALHKVLSPKRMEIIRALTGREPISIRELARRVGRDFKGVHGDVGLLLEAGVVDRDPSGKLSFPYERVHVDFEIAAAA